MISAANVKQALALYGAESLNKRDHFARLLSEFDFDSDGDEDMEEQERDDADESRPAPEEKEDADDTGQPAAPANARQALGRDAVVDFEDAVHDQA